MPDWRAHVREHLPALAVGPERENEIVAELAGQLEQAYAEALAGGASEAEAWASAAGQFRRWDELALEINRAERPRGAGLLLGLGQDVRYALRHFLRNPAFAVIAVLTLASGIGANVAVFSLVDALVLRSLPYRQPDRLMAIETRRDQQPEIEPWTSPPDFFDLRQGTRAFAAVAAIDPVWTMVLTHRGPAERVVCLFTSADLFSMLGVGPALGRLFSAQEDVKGKPPRVAVLSYAFWQRRLAGRADVLGQSLTLDGEPYTVIGAMPRDFRYAGEPLAGTASEVDVYSTLADNPLTTAGRSLRCLKLVGLLRPGVSYRQARDDVQRFGSSLAADHADTNRGFSMDAEPLRVQVTGRFRLTMMLMLGAVGFVLLMACANVAGLLLARAAARNREISVRVAIGATRMRLLRQLLTEGLALAALAGCAGLLVARLCLALLLATAPASLVRGREIGLDSRALLFAVGAVLVSAILAGLPPAWRLVRGDVAGALRESARGLTAGHHRLRSALVVGQVAVALVLLVGAGLLIRSFRRLMDVEPGFDARHLLAISTQVPPSLRTAEERTRFYRALHEQLSAVPGVRSVAAASRLPMQGMNLGSSLFIEGKSTPGEQGPDVEYRVVTNNYFAAMGIPLLAGRPFDDHDDAGGSAVAAVNQSMARRFWPGETAVGKRIKLGPSPEKQAWITIVGVVGDIRHFGLDAEPRPEVYRPYAVSPLFSPILAIRTEGDPMLLADTLAVKVRAFSDETPAYNVSTLQRLVDNSTRQRRFVMWMLTVFSLAGLFLAAVGIYGTISQTVALRTQEIGLRMALGASPAAAVGLVFRRGLWLTMCGAGIGVAAAAVLARFLRGLLFDIVPLDLPAFLAATLTLGVFALLACYVPARQATRVDPLEALRRE